jgi:hypothetical protein
MEVNIMRRSKSFRRFMMQKAKKHAKRIIRACWLQPELSEDVKIVGRFANHGKLCSCETCCNVRRKPHIKGKTKLTKREIFSLYDLSEYQLNPELI